MFRRQLIALGLALAMLLPLSAAADDRESAAAGLVDQMVADLEAFLATDTGDVEARSAEIDRVLTSYFDMDSITRFSAGPYWRATDEDELFDDNPLRFRDMQFYGGELNLRFASDVLGGGLTPYLVLGGGYLNVDDDYEAEGVIVPPDSRFFATGGVGLDVPLSSDTKGTKDVVLNTRMTVANTHTGLAAFRELVICVDYELPFEYIL